MYKIFFVLMSVSFPALADYKDTAVADKSFVEDERGNIDIDYYIKNCGSNQDVGFSRVFGSREKYEKPFPELGRFSAELDKVRKITSDDRAFYNERFKEAFDIQVGNYRMMAQIKFSYKRNERGLSRDPEVKSAFIETGEKNLEKIRKSIDYNTQLTIDKIKKRLSKPHTQAARGEYGISSMYYYNECKRWWDKEDSIMSAMPDISYGVRFNK